MYKVLACFDKEGLNLSLVVKTIVLIQTSKNIMPDI